MKSIFFLAPIALSTLAIAPTLWQPSQIYTPMSLQEDGTIKTSAKPRKEYADCQKTPDAAECKPPDWRRNPDCTDGELCMVAVDRAKLSQEQRSQFEGLVANLPSTAVGKQCRLSGSSDIWCLVLPKVQAGEVYAQLKTFGDAAANKAVNRFRGAKGGG